MNLAMMFTTVALILPITVLIAALILSSRSIMDREKASPFECGFDPKSTARIPFSMRFFLLAIIFIVFDIEIVLLMPIPLTMLYTNSVSMIITIMAFLVILTIGLLYEWKEGSLDWSY